MPPLSPRTIAWIAALAASTASLTSPAALAQGAASARLSYEPVATADLQATGLDAGAANSQAATMPVGADADSAPGANTPNGGGETDQPADAPPADAPAAMRGRFPQRDVMAEGEGQDAPQVHDRNGDRHLHIAPYIEAQQVVDAEISPHANTLTYSVLAAGVDGSIDGRNAQGSVSLRYERQIGESRNAGSADLISGVARGSVAVVPNVLRIDAAGYADRTDVLSTGAALPNIATNSNDLTQIYSVIGGPSVSTRVGDVKLDGHYHVGYTHVGSPGDVTLPSGASAGQIAQHSTLQDAEARAALKPGDVLPVGVAAEGGFYQEDVSVLAQRIRDEHVRGEVTIPVDNNVALVGGVGYENVQVSSRNAVLDAQGNPVLGAGGQLQTDQSSPRYIAFDTSGLIWDVGVLWKPSPRTSLEAHIGRRYGDIGGYGLFTWHPTSREALNIAVYNNMAGFGGNLDSSLINLSSQFSAVRNALTGSVSPCVNSLQGGCLSGSLGAVRSTIFRSRGVTASYNFDFGRVQLGLGAGYDHRQYLAAPGTVLAAQNGQVDQNTWITGYLTYEIDRNSSLSGTLDAYWFRSGLALDGDLTAAGATAVYQRRIARHLSASAALGVDSINRQALQDVWTASGELGLRYSF